MAGKSYKGGMSEQEANRRTSWWNPRSSEPKTSVVHGSSGTRIGYGKHGLTEYIGMDRYLTDLANAKPLEGDQREMANWGDAYAAGAGCES